MYLTKEKKEEIFAEYGKSAKDTGSVEAQIALFTYRIQHLTELMKKNKKDNKIAFIDASEEFKKETNQNRLDDNNIKTILGWYTDRKDVDYRVKFASHDEVAKNKYNLSVSTYVDKEDTREVIDIDELNKKIDEVVAKENQLRADIAQIIKEIG